MEEVFVQKLRALSLSVMNVSTHLNNPSLDRMAAFGRLLPLTEKGRSLSRASSRGREREEERRINWPSFSSSFSPASRKQ